MTWCTCGRQLQRREVAPGLVVWGHVTNPARDHHYPRPTSAPPKATKPTVHPRKAHEPVAQLVHSG
jgi:hypothetical protein